MIKAILFDFDGVITDSKWNHYRAFNKAVADVNIQLTKKEFSKLFGKPSHKTIMDLFKKYKIKEDFRKYVKKKDKIYYKDIRKVKPYKGAVFLIKKLAKDYKLALASNETRKDILALIKKFGIKKYFGVILGFENVKKQKPDPEIYLEAAKRLKLKPKECIVIEDSPYGIEAAKKAKMKCIALLTTHKKSDLEKADFIIKGLDSVEKILTDKL